MPDDNLRRDVKDKGKRSDFYHSGHSSLKSVPHPTKKPPQDTLQARKQAYN